MKAVYHNTDVSPKGREVVSIRRSALLAAALIICLPLVSCSISVDDLLVAPSLTEDQSSILAAVQAANTERTMLKYPISGELRTPIQLFDLDKDGAEDAVVYYNAAPEINTRIAVLGKEENGWEIKSELTGDGPEVNSVQILNGTAINLLVEWGSVNPNNRQITVYNFVDEKLRVGFSEEFSDMLKEDFNVDGVLEFCYVTASVPEELFKIKYADSDGGGYSGVSELELRPEMAALVNFQTRRTADGQQLFYVDESIEGNLYATEVFSLKNRVLSHIELEREYDLFRLSERQPELVCRSFADIGDSVVMIPSRAAPRETILDPALWTYWYYVENGQLNHGLTSYVNTSLNLNAGIPESWLETVNVIESPDDPRLFQMTDAGTGAVKFEIKVLRVEDSQQPYEELGFQDMQRSVGGAYRYWYRAGESCSWIDARFILDHFYGIV